MTARPLHAPLGLPAIEPFWGWMLTALLTVTGVALVLASRDLTRRASFVYWESLGRLIACGLLCGLGPPFLGWAAWFIGISDLGWGLLYLTLLPRAVSRSHRALLMDVQMD